MKKQESKGKLRLMKFITIIAIILAVSVNSIYFTVNGTHNCKEIKGIQTTEYSYGYSGPEETNNGTDIEGQTVTYTGRYYYRMLGNKISLEVKDSSGSKYWVDYVQKYVITDGDSYVSKTQLFRNENRYAAINALVLIGFSLPALLFIALTRNRELTKILFIIITVMAVQLIAGILIYFVINFVATYWWILVLAAAFELITTGGVFFIVFI